MSVLFGFWLAIPVTAEAPTQFHNYEDKIIKDNAIVASTNANTPTSKPTGWVQRGRHSTRAERTISEEQLKIFLFDRGSPLSPYAGQILLSPYWSTIIGICWIEQYHCTKAPGNNYWGIMCNGKVCSYESLSQGIDAISSLLAQYDAKGKDTLEELNCYYVQPCSQNWFNTVLKIKTQLEGL